MKILFVSSGTSEKGMSPIIKSQGESLIKSGIEIDYYTINRGGIKGYFKNIFALRKFINNNNYQIIHAHYGLSAIVAFFSKKRKQKIIVSFMGDDLVGSNDYNGNIEVMSKYVVKLNKFFAKYFYHYNIVKSDEMLKVLNLTNSMVISNGVDFKKFYDIPKAKAKSYLNEDLAIRKVLFCSDPKRPEKNYKLAKKAVESLSDKSVVIRSLSGIDQEKLVYYYNSSDCLLLTSFHEGSPNVIKEAMACNVPIVSTDVGDVRDVIGNTEGCFVTSFEQKEVTDKIKNALLFNKKTNGSDNIKHLEESVVAQKIINIYKKVLEK